MSSQEEYLDRLLKNLGAGNMDVQEPVKAEETLKPNRVFVDDSFPEQEDVSEEIAEQLSERNVSDLIDLLNETEPKDSMNELPDDLARFVEEDDELEVSTGFMSEEEVAKALTAAAMDQEENSGATEGDELFSMLDVDSSADSDPIKDLLEKDGQNLAVDAGILELLQGEAAEEPDLFDEGSETSEEISVAADDVASHRMNVAEKKALKEAKAAQKREKRDAKRQERAARREARRSAGRKTGHAEEMEGTVLPHVDINAVQYSNLNGAEDFAGEPAVADIGALYGMATVDMNTLQEASPVDVGVTNGNVTMGMDSNASIDGEDISAIQGIELTDLGLTGIDFMNLQEVQMNDADATADALFRQLSDDGMLNDVFGMSGEVEIVQSVPENSDVAGKKSKKGNQSGKGKGFFARFVDMITEEEEEEETESKGNENLSISDENKAILDELDALPQKKKKKGKTPEELEEIKKKKEEKRRAKAEKKGKKQETMPIRQKPLSRKKVGAVAILGISAVVIIVIISAVMIEYMAKREARQAYYNQDYEICYQNLFGKDLNESEQIMFHRSEMILKMRLWLREYEILAQEGSEMEALDSLIQSVHEYPALFEYSNKWNAGADVQAIYDELVNILNQKYHLTEKEAEEIAQIKDDVEYTKAVKAITEGMTYSDWKSQGSNGNNVSQSKDDTVNDDELPMIPGEEDGNNTQFIDNM